MIRVNYSDYFIIYNYLLLKTCRVIVVTLSRHIISSHYIVTLYRHIISSHYIVTLYRHIISSHYIVSLYRHIISSHYIVTLYRHIISSNIFYTNGALLCNKNLPGQCRCNLHLTAALQGSSCNLQGIIWLYSHVPHVPHEKHMFLMFLTRNTCSSCVPRPIPVKSQQVNTKYDTLTLLLNLFQFIFSLLNGRKILKRQKISFCYPSKSIPAAQ